MNYLIRELDTNGLRLCKYQGDLFERSLSKFDCSSPVFIRRFIKSKLVDKLDLNESSYISLSVEEGLDEIEQQFKKSEYGNEKYSSEEMFWLGYIYRYISYTRNISTKIAFKLFDYKLLRKKFFVYHTQSPEWVIQNLLEAKDFDEYVFDKNSRIKQMMINQKRFDYKA